MNRSRGKPRPWPTWVGAALGILVLTAAPPRIQARPYNPEYPPMPDGDPTADDQPSPTPKPKAMAVQIPNAQGTNQNATLGHSRTVIIRVPWETYLRLVIRYWVP